jgi:hypothetical protein
MKRVYVVLSFRVVTSNTNEVCNEFSQYSATVVEQHAEDP